MKPPERRLFRFAPLFIQGLRHNSHMSSGHPIAAIATAPGYAGVGVVRLSGQTLEVVAEALIGPLPAPRTATLRRFLGTDGRALDRGIVLYFKAPHSYTGEDVLELQGHGGPVVSVTYQTDKSGRITVHY